MPVKGLYLCVYEVLEASARGALSETRTVCSLFEWSTRSSPPRTAKRPSSAPSASSPRAAPAQTSVSSARHDREAVAAVPEAHRRALLKWAAMWLLHFEDLPENMIAERLAADFYKAFNEECSKGGEPGKLRALDVAEFAAIADRYRMALEREHWTSPSGLQFSRGVDGTAIVRGSLSQEDHLLLASGQRDVEWLWRRESGGTA